MNLAGFFKRRRRIEEIARRIDVLEEQLVGTELNSAKLSEYHQQMIQSVLRSVAEDIQAEKNDLKEEARRLRG